MCPGCEIDHLKKFCNPRRRFRVIHHGPIEDWTEGYGIFDIQNGYLAPQVDHFERNVEAWLERRLQDPNEEFLGVQVGSTNYVVAAEPLLGLLWVPFNVS